MKGQALGLIEVYGYVAAIEAADSAVKSANVELVAVEKVRGGLVTVILSGDVGAIKAAVGSGEESARRIGNYRSSHVIPRPVDDVFQMLLKKQNIIEEEQESITTIQVETSSSSEHEMQKVIEETLLPIAEEMETHIEESQEEVSSEEDQTAVTVENKASDSDKLLERLDNMTVVELRKMARSLKIGTMTHKQIKYARKKILIEEITKFHERGRK